MGTDSFTYNGLGLRVGKSDSTGTYSYVCDGTSPGSPILSDGHAVYTPGLSEHRGTTSSFYSFDQLGNLWTIDGTSQNQTYYQDGTAFGSLFALSGANPSGFGFSGGNGCQTDADTGLVLMGHRYYDTRQGRFISQDPIGNGTNWYVYAGNEPTNKTDSNGLTPMDGPGSSPMGTPGYNNVAESAEAGAYYDNEVLPNYTITHTWMDYGRWVDTDGTGNVIGIHDGDTGIKVSGSDKWSITDGGMIAGGPPPTWSSFWHEFWKNVLHELQTGGHGSANFVPRGTGQQEIYKVPDLTGKTRAEVDQILKGKGFNYNGKTPGGYEKYYHPDGGKIQIRPDGEVVRYMNKGIRVNQYGQEIPGHNTGEIVRE